MTMLRAASPHDLRAIADLGQRLEEIEAWHGGDKTVLRAALIDALRQALDEGHAEAEAALMQDQNGLACARRLSRLTDAVVRAIHAVTVRHFHRVNVPSMGERLALAAVGGYGRGTMAPHSDVDLLFLLPYKQTAWSESVVETMLYMLWDLKLKIGHATRSVDESLHEARGDMTIRTALLEARFLTGEKKLFEELEHRFAAEVVAGTEQEFVVAKLAERDTRIARAGASRYVVEPNVKEGKGGQRDLNILLWLAQYVYGARTPDALIKVGLFDSAEAAMFRRCTEFLWRVRCHMHFASGRAEERLSFGLQRTVSERIGYARRDGMSSVERFMKRYFLVAKDVGDLTAVVCAALEARHAKPEPVLDRFMRRLRHPRRVRLGASGFQVDNNRITVTGDDVFSRDPVNLLRLFWLSDRHTLAIHPDATHLARRSLKLIDRAVREAPEANRLFLDILTSRNAPETVLRAMNEAGVLGRFIPEFGRIVALMQFNMYHHYTVDEHLIRTLGVLARIDAGEMESEHPLSHQIIHTIQHRRALYVAAFLHDVAKGRPEDHSIAGAKMARTLGPRLGLDAAETETVAWLIENHLVMSTVAQSRDIADPETIRTFAANVQTLERLKLLLILTVCDIKAVGPGVWNGWKGELLRTLYYETEPQLTGGHSAISSHQRVAHAQAELRKALEDWDEATFDAYKARHYPAYWLKVDVSRKIKHARFIRETEAAGQTLAIATGTDKFRGVTELTVFAPDHPRLLAVMTGACAASGANIADAQVFTTTDGLALDDLFLTRAFEDDDDELRRAQKIARTIESALKGQLRIADLVDQRRPRTPKRPFNVPTELIIDNSLSKNYTVLEIAGLDRPGLLYDLTTALGKLSLNIASAHIVTFGEKAVDAFYVTDLIGAKITQPGKQAAIRKAVIAVFDDEDAGPG
ncbi:[protein-PII] uridylyltransferase [Pseudochelatococcus lubricantis]|uniref:Bifunctional uridylyltransferase/uridylyl-removing enzyme n=1 Tax=Pseudochelatococcus lubricantis TaxID=1538102 RepID=A0ABX0UYY9_9HYPH|nr:[protein-PII] uridylyltransferase [Pseudochelatococcus lubricantis]NIJ56800.1 [protein-PII] uridylyltransferase [Pseudochelatococcus lubricantis]